MTAVLFALAELQGAADAPAAFAALEPEDSARSVLEIRAREDGALVDAGLVSPVEASASAHLRVEPQLRPTSDSEEVPKGASA